ncbi:MAG: MFS transporter [Acidiphilium sp.]
MNAEPASPSILPFAVMCVGMFVALLDIQIVASSLQDIGGGLSAAQDQISWVQTACLIAEITIIPLSGWLTRVFSTRWLFVARSLTFRNPVVDLRALGNRNFLLGCILSFITGIGIFSTIYLYPAVPRLRARLLGLADRRRRVFDRHRLADRRAGLYCARPPIRRAPNVTLGLGSLGPARLKYASGLFNMMRNLGGAVGIAVCGAMLNDRTNAHFQAIAAHLTPANGAMTRLVANVSARYGAIPGTPDAGHAAALIRLRNLAYAQASTLAYADAFRAMMLAFVVAVILVPFMRKVAPPKLPAAEGH